jgi:hypothetical protein
MHYAAKLDWDPVAPAKRSQAATGKAQTGTLPDGTSARTLMTVLDDLATITRNDCTHPETGVTFSVTTSPNPNQ